RVPPQVVTERRRRVLEIERELADAYFRSLLGRTLDVLVEGADPERPGFVRGTTCRYAPVAFEGRVGVLVRRRVPVRAVSVAEGVVLGRPEPEAGLGLQGWDDRRIALL